MKPRPKQFDVWVKRTHTFTARVKAETMEEALTKARSMTIDQLVDAPGDTNDDEHELTAVMEA